MRCVRVYQIGVIAGLLLLLEALCLAGVIDKITMPPPHRIAVDFVKLLLAGKLYPEIGKSLANVMLAFGLAFSIGIVTGTVLHGYRTARQTLDPLFATYYAIPVFAFYPLFIVIFGLGDGPQVLIGFMLGVVAVIVTTLNGLDRVPRVLRKTASICGMGPFDTAIHVTLPFCAPYLLTAAKLALAYAFIGLLVFWELMYLIIGDVAMRSPWQTMRYTVTFVQTELFWTHLPNTLQAFAVALAIAVVLGLLTGFALGLHRLSAEAMEPMLVALYSIPKITLYPIILLVFGLGMSAKIAFGAIHGIIPVALFTLNAVRSTKPILVKTGRVLKLSPPAMVRSILF